MRKSKAMLEIEAEREMPIDLIMVNLINQGFSNDAAAAELGISVPTFNNWLGRLGIEVKRIAERWQDGKVPV